MNLLQDTDGCLLHADSIVVAGDVSGVDLNCERVRFGL